MTIISRYSFNRTSRKAMRALASAEVLHAIVARAADPQITATRAPGTEHALAADRTLWRLDPGRERHRLFIVSQNRPAADVLATELGGDATALESLDYRPLLTALRPGQEWRFRLKANPTKALPRGHGQRGRRVGIIRPADQIAWLTSRAEQIGVSFPQNRFNLPEVIVRDTAMVEFRRHEATVSLMTAVLDGFLTVVDPDLLRTALIGGIGRAKGYGYGLLTLAKPDTVAAPVTAQSGHSVTSAAHHG